MAEKTLYIGDPDENKQRDLEAQGTEWTDGFGDIEPLIKSGEYRRVIDSGKSTDYMPVNGTYKRYPVTHDGEIQDRLRALCSEHGATYESEDDANTQ